MTRQVLAAGRSRPATPGPHDLNAAVADMEPILRRVAGPNVEVAVAWRRACPPCSRAAASSSGCC